MPLATTYRHASAMRRAALGLRGRRGARCRRRARAVVARRGRRWWRRRRLDSRRALETWLRGHIARGAPEVAGVSSATWGNAGHALEEPARDDAVRARYLVADAEAARPGSWPREECVHSQWLPRRRRVLPLGARAGARSNPSDCDWPTAHADAQRYLMERAAALGAGGLRVAGGEVRSSTGAVLSSDAGDALGDSALYAKALAADCKARGLHVWTNAPAEAVDGGGVTVDGARVDADAVVLCAGARRPHCCRSTCRSTRCGATRSRRA